MRIVFMGTPDFAVSSLERLLLDGHEVCAVFTQPDKPVGRKHVQTPPPVKVLAAEKGIPVYQPTGLRDEGVLTQLQMLVPELIVVVAYGKILPKTLLEIPKYGCVNVHGSLLPQYRGAAPIQWSVIKGEPVAGVTTMQMDVGMDTGDILHVLSTSVNPDETSGELYERLSKIGAQALSETLAKLGDGLLAPVKQDESQATYAPMLTKGDSPIDWKRSAQEIHNQVRGLSPWPSAQTTWEDKTLKIHKTQLSDTEMPDGIDSAAGKIVCLDPLAVVCGDGNGLILLEVQLAGGKRMDSGDFLRGNRLTVGTKLV